MIVVGADVQAKPHVGCGRSWGPQARRQGSRCHDCRTRLALLWVVIVRCRRGVGCRGSPHLERVGATIRYGGTVPAVIIGDGQRPWWDAILIVEYPSPAAFIDMVTTEEYAKVHKHRAGALERGDLIATSIRSIAE